MAVDAAAYPLRVLMKRPILASIAVASALVACTPVAPPNEAPLAASLDSPPASPPPVSPPLASPPMPDPVEPSPPPVAGRNCEVEVRDDPSQFALTESWSLAFVRLDTEQAAPSEQAARKQLCRNHDCSGPGPWIVGLHPPDGDRGFEHLAVVIPRPDGRVEMLTKHWYSNPNWECNHKNVLRAEHVADTSALVHVRVEYAGAAGEWHSCPSQGAEGCVEYCREVTFSTQDWFLDPDTRNTLALVTRTKLAGPEHGRPDYELIPDASQVGDDVDLRVDGRVIELDGCGIRKRIEL
jgi:hypothetical protein